MKRMGSSAARSYDECRDTAIRSLLTNTFRSASKTSRMHSTDRRLRPGVVFLFLIWMGLIFGTSCTVILPEKFFGLVQTFTGVDATAMERFRVFWGVSWFAIVKGWHFTEFAILLVLCVNAIRWWRGSITRWSIVGGMLACIAFAISDEWHQSFVPKRFGTVQDVFIDSLGVCVAGTMLLIRHHRNTTANPENNVDRVETDKLSSPPSDL